MGVGVSEWGEKGYLVIVPGKRKVGHVSGLLTLQDGGGEPKIEMELATD